MVPEQAALALCLQSARLTRALEGFFRVERGVDTSVDDPRAPLASHAADHIHAVHCRYGR